jgi:hypothetical protein
LANLDFFAARTDLRAVIEFLFTETDVRVFESYSEPDRELREFRSFDGLDTVSDIGTDRFGNGTAILLRLWSPSVCPEPEIVRFSLDPAKCQGHTFRHRIDSGGLIQLYLGGVHDRVVTHSHLGNFERAGAEKWGVAEGADWTALASLSRRIQYHIRKRLAVAKVPRYPILSEAMSLARSGYTLRYSMGASCYYRFVDGEFVHAPILPARG